MPNWRHAEAHSEKCLEERQDVFAQGIELRVLAQADVVAPTPCLYLYCRWTT